VSRVSCGARRRTAEAQPAHDRHGIDEGPCWRSALGRAAFESGGEAIHFLNAADTAKRDALLSLLVDQLLVLGY
jgi:hypothetical protein